MDHEGLADALCEAMKVLGIGHTLEYSTEPDENGLYKKAAKVRIDLERVPPTDRVKATVSIVLEET